jgi:hypothetical protein
VVVTPLLHTACAGSQQSFAVTHGAPVVPQHTLAVHVDGEQQSVSSAHAAAPVPPWLHGLQCPVGSQMRPVQHSESFEHSPAATVQQRLFTQSPLQQSVGWVHCAADGWQAVYSQCPP